MQARLRTSFGDTATLYVEAPFGSTVSQPIADGDYVLATTLPRIGRPVLVQVGGTNQMLPYGRNIRTPLRDADVLDKDELSRITGVLNTYNNYLEVQAGLYKLPIITAAGSERTLDLNVALFNQVAGVISVGGVQYSSEPVRGNFFSLDYYSLTPRGNGLLANAFIKAFNKAYRANLSGIDVNSLPATAR